MRYLELGRSTQPLSCDTPRQEQKNFIFEIEFSVVDFSSTLPYKESVSTGNTNEK